MDAPHDVTRDLTVEYTRLPDDVVRWKQWKLHEDNDALVTAFYDGDLPRPIVAGGRTVVEGSFYGITYFLWDRWYNVIRVYDEGLEFSGYYSDVMTPVQKTWTVVRATDLFLDLFVFPDGTYSVEDESEFERAVAKGTIDEGIQRKARETMDELVGMARAGTYPPECVRRFPTDPVSVLRQVRRWGRH